jgi:hypothetical protein
MPRARKGKKSLRSKRSRRHSRKQTRRQARKQRGGQLLPSGYDDSMTVAYRPKSDEIGDVDSVPRIGSATEFKEDVEKMAGGA